MTRRGATVRRQNHDRGAAMVEFALVLPILLMLVFGIVEFGRLYNIETSINAAAREGARVMALESGPDSVNIATEAAASAAEPYALSKVDVSVTPTPTSPADPHVCPNPNTTQAVVRVTVTTSPVDLLTGWFFSHAKTIALTGTGVMRCNG